MNDGERQILFPAVEEWKQRTLSNGICAWKQSGNLIWVKRIPFSPRSVKEKGKERRREGERKGSRDSGGNRVLRSHLIEWLPFFLSRKILRATDNCPIELLNC